MKHLTIVVPPLLKHNETALVDLGCTGHFLLSKAPCLNKTLTANTLTVRLKNFQTKKSTHTATLDIPQLSKVAKAAHVFPAMENNSLLFVGNYAMKVILYCPVPIKSRSCMRNKTSS
jgi:hypothetical protein